MKKIEFLNAITQGNDETLKKLILSEQIPELATYKSLIPGEKTTVWAGDYLYKLLQKGKINTEQFRFVFTLQDTMGKNWFHYSCKQTSRGCLGLLRLLEVAIQKEIFTISEVRDYLFTAPEGEMSYSMTLARYLPAAIPKFMDILGATLMSASESEKTCENLKTLVKGQTILHALAHYHNKLGFNFYFKKLQEWLEKKLIREEDILDFLSCENTPQKMLPIEYMLEHALKEGDNKAILSLMGFFIKIYNQRPSLLNKILTIFQHRVNDISALHYFLKQGAFAHNIPFIYKIILRPYMLRDVLGALTSKSVSSVRILLAKRDQEIPDDFPSRASNDLGGLASLDILKDLIEGSPHHLLYALLLISADQCATKSYCLSLDEQIMRWFFEGSETISSHLFLAAGEALHPSLWGLIFRIISNVLKRTPSLAEQFVPYFFAKNKKGWSIFHMMAHHQDASVNSAFLNLVFSLVSEVNDCENTIRHKLVRELLSGELDYLHLLTKPEFTQDKKVIKSFFGHIGHDQITDRELRAELLERVSALSVKVSAWESGMLMILQNYVPTLTPRELAIVNNTEGNNQYLRQYLISVLQKKYDIAFEFVDASQSPAIKVRKFRPTRIALSVPLENVERTIDRVSKTSTFSDKERLFIFDTLRQKFGSHHQASGTANTDSTDVALCFFSSGSLKYCTQDLKGAVGDFTQIPTSSKLLSSEYHNELMTHFIHLYQMLEPNPLYLYLAIRHGRLVASKEALEKDYAEKVSKALLESEKFCDGDKSIFQKCLLLKPILAWDDHLDSFGDYQLASCFSSLRLEMFSQLSSSNNDDKKLKELTLLGFRFLTWLGCSNKKTLSEDYDNFYRSCKSSGVGFWMGVETRFTRLVRAAHERLQKVI